MLVCSKMASPDAHPNIKAYLQKKNKDLTRDSTSDNIFQNVVFFRGIDAKL